MVSWLRRYRIHGNSQPAVLRVHCEFLMLKTTCPKNRMLESSWLRTRMKSFLWAWQCEWLLAVSRQELHGAQKLTGSCHLYSWFTIIRDVTNNSPSRIRIQLNHTCARCATGLWSMPSLWVMWWRLGPHLVLALSLGCSLPQRINPLILSLNQLPGKRGNWKTRCYWKEHVTGVWL